MLIFLNQLLGKMLFIIFLKKYFFVNFSSVLKKVAKRTLLQCLWTTAANLLFITPFQKRCKENTIPKTLQYFIASFSKSAAIGRLPCNSKKRVERKRCKSLCSVFLGILQRFVAVAIEPISYSDCSWVAKILTLAPTMQPQFCSW